MHELTICESLLERIAQERETRAFTRVKSVRLEIGLFSCVDPEALQYAFELLGRGTFLEEAALKIDRPRGRATCLDCGAEVEIDDRQDDCPACGTGRLKATGGDKMRFIEMEVL